MSLAVILTVFLLQAVARQWRWPDLPWLAPWLQPLKRLPPALQLFAALLMLWLLYGLLHALLRQWPFWLWLLHSALLYSAMGPAGRLSLVLKGQISSGVLLDKGPKSLLLVDQWIWYLLLPLICYGLFSVPGLLLVLVLQQGRLAHSWRLRRAMMSLLAWPLYRFLRLSVPPMVPVVHHLSLLAMEPEMQPERLYSRLQQGRWWLWGLACGIGLLKMLF